MTEIPKAPINRIAKQNGAERISKEAQQKLVEAIEQYTQKLTKAIIDITHNADRKTIQVEDVELATKYHIGDNLQ